jgi:hypothetical protein
MAKPDDKKSIVAHINTMHDKLRRISACHSTLLELSKTLPTTTQPREEGIVCHEFVFPELLKGIREDVNSLTEELWEIEDVLKGVV